LLLHNALANVLETALKAPPDRQNNVCIGTTMPKGAEWYLYLAHCEAVLGTWTYRPWGL